MKDYVFLKNLADNKKLIISYLKYYLTKTQKVYPGKFSEDLVSKILEYTSNGKMIRGSMIIDLAIGLKKNSSKKDLVKIAAAIELFQSALLIQDDIMDNDDSRRGLLAIHKQYEKNFNTDVSKNISICLSDVVIFVGFKILAEIKNSKILDCFSKNLINTGFGQMIDVSLNCSFSNEDCKYNTIIEMYIKKTASYTFILPFEISAIFSKKENLISSLTSLGKDMGVLFQIKDDLLGLIGENIGKPVGSDIYEKKNTLYIAKLIGKVTNDEKKKLKKIYSKKISQKDYKYILDLINKYKIVEEIEKVIFNLSRKIKKQIVKLNVSKNIKEYFNEINSFIVERKK